MLYIYIPVVQLQDYCEKNLSSGRLALVGVGVDSAVLEALGESFAPHAGAQGEADAKAVYYGGLKYVVPAACALFICFHMI